eukprot:jgi/Psemu1/29577/gm1.29577_g
MSSNFLKNSPPKSTSHATYNHLSTIKPKKKACQSIYTNLKHVEQIALITVNKDGGLKEYTSTEAVSIDSFETLDSMDEKYIIAFDESEPSLRIFAKVSREKAKQHLAQYSNIQNTREFLKDIVEAKPEVVRGSKCTSINNGYAVLDELERTVAHIVEEMQESSRPIAKFFYHETTVMTKVVQQTTIISIGDHATTFSIGKDCHSKCHVDEDYFYTHLTVIALEHVSDDEVIYYFRVSSHMQRKNSTQHYMDPASFAEVIKIHKEDMAHLKKNPKNNISNPYKRNVLKTPFCLDSAEYSAEYCVRSNELNHGNGNDKRNPFLYHFETGFDVLCAKNGHLVLTILNGCNKINNVRATLNSQKGHFDEEEGLEIWEQCLKYVTEDIFPFSEEGDTGCVDHDIQCYNNMGIGQPVQSGEQERLKLNGHTFPPKQWCNLTPEARNHIKECIHFNLGNRPCLTSLWFNDWRTMTEEAIIEKYRRRYIEETDDVKERKKETEKNEIKYNWNSFMKKATKQEEEDGNKRNIVHWLHLYEKHWKSPEDLEEYNNYPIPRGAWGHVK